MRFLKATFEFSKSTFKSKLFKLFFASKKKLVTESTIKPYDLPWSENKMKYFSYLDGISNK